MGPGVERKSGLWNPAVGIFATRCGLSMMPDALGDLNTGLHILEALSRPSTYTTYIY